MPRMLSSNPSARDCASLRCQPKKTSRAVRTVALATIPTSQRTISLRFPPSSPASTVPGSSSVAFGAEADSDIGVPVSDASGTGHVPVPDEDSGESEGPVEPSGPDDSPPPDDEESEGSGGGAGHVPYVGLGRW